ncbi:MAG: flippase, partial [Christensenellaceae bacterium]
IGSLFALSGFFEHFTVDVFLNVSLLFFAPVLFSTKEAPEAEFVREGGKRSLVENFISYAGYTLLQVVIPLVTIVYVSKLLGAEGVGKVSYAQTIVSYFTIIASLGIPHYGTREMAKCKTETERNRTFTQIFMLNVFSTTVCLVAYLGMISLVESFALAKKLYVAAGIAILLNYVNVDWLFRGTEEYSYLTESSVIMKGISLVCILVFVTDRGDTAAYALFSAFALTGAGILNVIYARRFIRFDFTGFDWKRHLKPVFVLLAANVAIELYTLLDVTMLGIFKTDAEVGYYSNAVKLVKTVVTVLTAIGAVMLPRLSVSMGQDRGGTDRAVSKTLKILLLVCVPAFAGLYLLSDSLVLALFGAEYLPAVPMLMALSPLVVIMGVGNLFGTQVLLSANAERKLLLSVVCGALTNLAMNLVLIPSFGGKGAAIASVASELVVMLLQLVFARKYCKFAFDLRSTLIVLISTALMAAVVVLVRMLVTSAVWELLIAIVPGVAVYFGVCILLREETVLEGVSLAKGKLSSLLPNRGKRIKKTA